MPLSQLYSCCQFTFSSELVLPHVPKGTGTPEVELRLQSFTPHANRADERGGEGVWAYATADSFELRANGIARYLVRGGREIWIDPFPGADERAVTAILLTIVWAALLQQRGFLVLHGGVVQLGGVGLALLGNSGVGKSSLVSYLQRQGAVVLSDELCALLPDESGKLHAWPIFPQMSLCRDALERQDQPADPAFEKWGDKWQIPVRLPAKSPLYLNRVVELRKSSQGLSWKGVAGLEKLQILLRNTYLMPALVEMAAGETHLQLCSALVRQAEFRIVTRPQERLEEEAYLRQLYASLNWEYPASSQSEPHSAPHTEPELSGGPDK